MQNLNTMQRVHTFFLFGEAREAFRKYCHAPTAKDSKSSKFSMAVFDAVITETVHSFKSILQDVDGGEVCIGEKTQTVHSKLQERAIHPRKRYVRLGKGRVIPH